MKKVIFILIFITETLFAIGVEDTCKNIIVLSAPNNISVKKGIKTNFNIKIKNLSSKNCNIGVYNSNEPNLIIYLKRLSQTISPNESIDIGVSIGYSYEENKKSFNKDVIFYINSSGFLLEQKINIDFFLEEEESLLVNYTTHSRMEYGDKSIENLDINPNIIKQENITPTRIDILFGVVVVLFSIFVFGYFLYKLFKFTRFKIYSSMLDMKKNLSSK